MKTSNVISNWLVDKKNTKTFQTIIDVRWKLNELLEYNLHTIKWEWFEHEYNIFSEINKNSIDDFIYQMISDMKDQLKYAENWKRIWREENEIPWWSYNYLSTIRSTFPNWSKLYNTKIWCKRAQKQKTMKILDYSFNSLYSLNWVRLQAFLKILSSYIWELRYLSKESLDLYFYFKEIYNNKFEEYIWLNTNNDHENDIDIDMDEVFEIFREEIPF